MGLDTVLNGIRERGKRRADEIRTEAGKEAERIVAEAKEEADDKIAKAKEEADRDAEPMRRRELLGAEIDAKKLRLDAQREAMESVRDRARERLEALSEEERSALLKALVGRVHQELASPRIYASQADADLVRSIAGDAFAGTRSIRGGVVAESGDGTVLVDYSFESLLDEVWQEATREVAELLRK